MSELDARELLGQLERERELRALLLEGAPFLGVLGGLIALSVPDEVRILRTICAKDTRPWVRKTLLGLSIAQFAHAGFAAGRVSQLKKTETAEEKARRLRTPPPFKVWPHGVARVSAAATTVLAGWERSGGRKRSVVFSAAAIAARSGAIWWLRRNQAHLADVSDELDSLNARS